MKIFLGSDHAGFELKEKVKEFLEKEQYLFEDLGAYKHDPLDDYPDLIKPVAKEVAKDPEKNRGIIFGKSGQGEAIVANRFKGVRAIVFYGGPEKIIKLSREHNNANVLSLGADFLKPSEAVLAIRKWLDAEFAGEERHSRRIEKIDK